LQYLQIALMPNLLMLVVRRNVKDKVRIRPAPLCAGLPVVSF
jgi:hypothetical protein